jgi:uncharacterized protein (UPF0147 family)
MILRYDQNKLRERIHQLPKSHRTIFAAACAERLLPSYSSSNSSGEDFKEAMLLLWNDLIDDPVPENQLRAAAKRCEKLIQGDEDDQDAPVAVAYALRSIWEEGTEEAQWAATRAYNSVDAFLTERESGPILTKDMMRRISEHPIVQAELLRQQRDLDDLLNARGESVKLVAARFRDRAKEEANFFFGADEPGTYREK